MAEQGSVVDRENKTLSTSTTPAKEDTSKHENNPLCLEQKPINKHLTISTTISHHESHKSNHYFGKNDGLLSPSSNTKIMDSNYSLLKPASCNDLSKSKSPVSNKVSDCSLNNNNIHQNHSFQNGNGKKKKKKKDCDRDDHKDLNNKDKSPSQLSEDCNTIKVKANDGKNNVFSLKNFVKHEHESESSFDPTAKSPKKKHKDGKAHSQDSQNHKSTHGSKRKKELKPDGTPIKKVKHRHNHIKLDKKEFPSEKLFSPTDKVKKYPNFNQPILQFEKLPIKKIKTIEQVGEQQEKHIKKTHKSSHSIKEEKPPLQSLPSSPTKLIDNKSKNKTTAPIEDQKTKYKATGTVKIAI